MKPKIKNGMIVFAKVILFVALFLMIFRYSGYVLRNKSKTEAIALNFDKPNGSFDVILAGPSHMQYSLQPAQLFGEYGITSCNISSTAQSIPTTYHLVKEMIRRHDPKLVVIDLFCLFYPEAYFTPTRFHQAMDSFPTGPAKAAAINDLVPQERAEFYVDYLLYHGRWKSLTEYDYTAFSTFNETYQLRKETQSFPNDFVAVDPQQKAEIPPLPLEYLEKIVTLCKETDTQLLLTVIPYRADVDNNDTSAQLQQKIYNTAADYAKEWGVDFINGLHYLEEMNFDFTTDMLEYSHVNARGAQKVTTYYGKYIKERYDLPDHSEDAAYEHWHEDYAEYLQLLQEIIK